jgi:uncharacterized membrane protein YbhN (UPF0104 family)
MFRRTAPVPPYRRRPGRSAQAPNGRSEGHRPDLFERLHGRPLWLAGAAVAIGAGVLVLVAGAAGWPSVVRAFGHVHPGWIALCVGGQVVAIAGYVAAFRSVESLGSPHRLPLRTVATIVVAGFGSHAIGGGFAIDRRALIRLGHDESEATIRVLGLGALEYAVLAPLACGCAVLLLIEGSDVQSAVLWPWAIAVPAGLTIGLWLARPARWRDPEDDGPRLRSAWRHTMQGVGVLHLLALRPLHHADAWLGMAVYWIADIATLYGALRLFGVHLGLPETVLAYAAGYAATRRTLPLGGAGATEALMSFSLAWVGLSLAQAVPVVAAYRLANVVLPLLPAARAQRDVFKLTPPPSVVRRN